MDFDELVNGLKNSELRELKALVEKELRQSEQSIKEGLEVRK